MKLESWEQLEPILLDFEARWREGNVPAIDDFLPESASNQVELLAELVMIDFEHRFKQKSTTNIDGYFENWPELEADAETRRNLLAHEFELRRKADAFPSQAEIESRFGDDPTVAELHSSTSNKTTLQELSLDVGTKVNSYVVERRIGRGAFSTVYSAMHGRLQRRTALKFLSQSNDLKPEMRQRMLREAQAVASLEHPNIVPVYETGEFQDHDYIASRFIDGTTLAERIESKSITIEAAIRITSQLADALAASHRAGIVHRDIKPANIMLDGDVPLLLDFGLAHLGDATLQLTHEGDMLGTPAYMSPEQADGQAFQGDPRSDIYSVGVVLYQMVCGRLPFEGSTTQVITQVLHNEPTRPRDVNANISRDLQTVILKCLQKEPLDRFQSATELQADLDRLSRGEPIHARSIGFAARALKWAKRRPLVAALLSVIIVLGGFLAGVASQVQKVADQRDLAETAKQDAEQLLAESAASAGLLAMQRGRMQSAINHFEQALEMGHPDRAEIMLRIVESSIVRRDLDTAVTWLKKAEADSSSSEHATNLAVWRAELAFEGFEEFGEPLAEFNKLCSLELNDDDEHYVNGILAETSPDAVDSFHLATEANPFHHRARRMLIFMLVSLGRFDEALTQCQIASQLYPEDEDFRLLEALAVAATGDVQQSHNLLNQIDSLGDDVEAWSSLAELIDDVVNNNEKFIEGRDQLDLRKLTGSLIGFRTGELQTILDRKWRLPPRITSAFVDVANSLPMTYLHLATFGPRGPNEALTHLAEVHPESSLLIMHATHCLAQVPNTPQDHDKEIALLREARDAHEQALQNPGFINNRLLSQKGIFITSLLLADRYKQNEEANHARMMSAMRTIAEDGAPEKHARVYSITAFKHNDLDEANRWTDYWITTTEPETNGEFDALWHRMIYLQRTGNWLEVKQICEQLLEIRPDHAPTKGALRKAIATLNAAIESPQAADN